MKLIKFINADDEDTEDDNIQETINDYQPYTNQIIFQTKTCLKKEWRMR